MDDPPRDNNICPSCGTEFGYHDAGRTLAELRAEWLNTGAKWSSKFHQQPTDWDAMKQLTEAGEVTVFGFSDDRSKDFLWSPQSYIVRT